MEICFEHMFLREKNVATKMQKMKKNLHWQMVDDLIGSLENPWAFLKASISTEAGKHNKEYYRKNCKKWDFEKEELLKNANDGK